MADQNLTDLTEITAPVGTDLLYTVNDPGTQRNPRKITKNNLIKRHEEEIEHKVISAPPNPIAGYVKVYPKQIDANNDGYFVKARIAGAVREVRIV